MASRTGDANLIKGAGIANKDYSNDPAIYAGIDKVVAKGNKMFAENINAFDLQVKVEKDKQEQQSLAFGKAADKALARDGSFDTKVDFDHWTLEVEEARKTNDFQALNNITQYISKHKNLRKSLSGLEMSNAMNNSGTVGGNDGRQQEVITSFLNQSYTHGKNEKGETTYNGITDSGFEYSVTLDQVENMFIPADPEPSLNFLKIYKRYGDARDLDMDLLNVEIKNILPKKPKELRAFMADEIYNGQNFKDMLDSDNNFESEIGEQFDTNETEGLQPEEIEAFKLAIIDPYSPVWKGDMNTWAQHSKLILQERLANSVRNKNLKKYPLES
tara:strand:- start:4186 stop:5175 length:990 start_codon:yes stop_codon:yes gene_type:complete